MLSSAPTSELTPRALIDEGDAMHHCVGSYWEQCLVHGTRIVQVTLPDGERAFVGLGDVAPRSVRLDEFSIEGDGIRVARMKPDASQLCGLGLARVAGVAELAQPGMLALVRAGGAVYITTDVGVALAPAWLGGAVRRIEALTLAGDWADVTQPETAPQVTAGLVSEWSQRNQRTFVTFRISV